jgi:hypothetical protein
MSRTLEMSRQLSDSVRRQKILEFLAETGWKPYVLEDLAGVGRNAIYSFVEGKRSYFLDTWLKIERAMAEYRKTAKKAS